jgi:hypothetical protein
MGEAVYFFATGSIQLGRRENEDILVQICHLVRIRLKN